MVTSIALQVHLAQFTIMKKYLLLVLLPFYICCNTQVKTDLAKLNLNEAIDSVINYGDKKTIGLETLEYPFSLLVEVRKSNQYIFNSIELKDQNIFFLINYPKINTDSNSNSGHGSLSIESFSKKEQLKNILAQYKAGNAIFGYRLVIETKTLKDKILNQLVNLYGPGTKNPNIENGLYWNLKSQNKWVFFAPDYDRLVMINNTHLSKTCYWDNINGTIDFGGCDKEKYFEDMRK
jgi:hypothetical protein